MVAIVSGNGFGLLTGSAGVLGRQGQYGNAVQGNNHEASYLNVMNGNLVLQDGDDFLAAHGVNLAITRTYNSQGSYNDGNGAGWKYGLARQVSGLTGTVNTAGSKVYRTAGDGSVATFSYLAAKAAYVSTDGDGATQSMVYNAANREWTWRADRYDTVGLCEVYDDSNGGRIVRTEDHGVVRQKFGYNAAGRLAQVTDSAGATGAAADAVNNSNDQTYFDYDANGNLSQIRSVLAGTAGSAVQSLVRTRYAYDELNRLTTVTVDLSTVNVDAVTGKLLLNADNNSVADGVSYTTTYSYDGASSRIAKVAQSDGTELNLTYKQYGGAWKVDTFSDALGRQTSIDYSVANKATVTDPLGLKTVYGFDALGQLTDVTGPAVNGVSQVLRYTYDANGNLATQTDARGLTTTYSYDANNNRIKEVDSNGFTSGRLYDLNNNNLLADIRYALANPAVGSDSARNSYTYDPNGRLHYIIDPEFRLTEFRYNSNGELASEIHYPDKFWPAGGWKDLFSQNDPNINTALAGAYFDKTRTVRTDYAYDARGLRQSATRYASVDAAGNGVLDGQQSVTTYIYDQAGQLLYSRDGKGNLSTRVYDGLGRLLGQTDANGTQLTSVYDSRSNLTVTSTASGAPGATVTTSYVHDNAGQVISVQQQVAGGLAGTTRNVYDSDGQLRMSTSADGQNTYWLYDAAGRKVAQIEHNGALTEFVYNPNNQLVKTTRYVDMVSTTGLLDLNGQPAAVALDTLRPSTNAALNRSTWNGYDLNGRLVASVDANGFVTRMNYDGLSRMTSSVVRAKGSVAIAALGSAPVSAVALLPGEVATPAEDHLTSYIYDHNNKLLGTIDPAGYLTENRYDAGGRLVETIAYTNPASARAGAITAVRPVTLVPASDIHQYFLYNTRDQQVGSINGDGFLTELTYDTAGNIATRRSYAGKVATPAAATLALVGKTNPLDYRQTSYTYNALNQLDRETNLDGSYTQYRYDDNGKVISVTRDTPTTAELVSNARYDGAGRLMGELSAEGTSRLAALGAAPKADDVAQLWALYGSHYSYSADGLRTSAADAQGKRTLYFYDSIGRLTHTVDGAGDVQEQRYNAFNQVVKTIQYGKRLDAAVLATLVGGRNDKAFAALNLGSDATASELYYDSTGRLRYTIDGAGQIQERSYTAFNQLQQTISYSSRITGAALATLAGGDATAIEATLTAYRGAASQRTTLYYDANGRLRYSVDPLGDIQGQTYDAFGRVTATTDYALRVTAPAALTGAVSELAAFAVANAGNTVQSYLYNLRGGVVDLTVNGNHTLTSYNGYGQAIKVARLATAASIVAAPLADQIVQTVYDSNGRVAASIDATGTVTAFQYDGDGHVVDRVRYANALAGYATSADIAKTYNDALAAKTLSDPARDQHQRYIYDNNGDLAVTLTAQTTLVTKDGQNNPVYNVRWDVVRQSRDGAGRVIVRTAYSQRMAAATLTPATADVLAWMAAADVRSVNDPELVNGKLADGGEVNDAVTRYVYDGAGRLAATATAQHHDGAGIQQWSVVRQDYDARGNVIARSALANLLTQASPSDSDIQNLAASPADAVTRYNYDGANRVILTAVAQGPTDQYATPPSTQQWAITRINYDDLGNVSSRVQYGTLAQANSLPADLGAAVTANGNLDRTTRYRYDGGNRLVVTIDATGAITRVNYDSNGNAAQSVAYADLASTPDAITADYNPAPKATDRVSRTVYDLLHRPVYQIDALGQVTERTYDVLGNLTSTIRYATALTADKQATLAAAGVNASVAGVKALLAAPVLLTDRVERYAYDQDGQLRYTVDAAGYLKETIYNALGQVAETREYLQLPTTAIALAPTMASLDAEAQRQYGLGYASVNKFGYDAKGNLVSSTDPTNIPETYQYDALGNKISFTNKAGSTWTYRYDAAGRMVQEISPQVAAYVAEFNFAMGNWGSGVDTALVTMMEYDALGNLTKRTEAAGTASERYTRYGYDAVGRQTRTILQAVGIYDDAGDPKIADGVAVPQERNSGERITKVTYNAFGDAVANQDVGGQISYKVYDLRGQVAFDIDALGYVTGYKRTSDSQQLTRYYNRPQPLAGGKSPAQASADEFSKSLVLDKANDRSITTSYDLLGRVVKVASPLTDLFDQHATGLTPYISAGKTTDTYYTTFGEVREQASYGANAQGARVTDAVDSRYYYDARGNKKTQIDVLDTDAGGHTGTGYVTSYDYGFDIATKTSTVTRTEFATVDAWNDAQPNGGALPNAAGTDRVTRSVYDKSHQLLSETKVGVTFYANTALAGGEPVKKTGDVVTSYGYDVLGRQNTVIDAMGGTSYTYYDALGRTIAVAKVQAPGFPDLDAAPTPLTEFKLDILGNTVFRIDYATGVTAPISGSSYTPPTAAMRSNAANRVTVTNYDKAGRAIIVMDPEQFSRQAAPHDTPPIISFIYSSYDVYGRVAKQWRSVTSDGQQQTSYQITRYDALGRVRETETPGNVNLVTNAAAQRVRKSTAYNMFGEVVNTYIATGNDAAQDASQRVELSRTAYDQAGHAWYSNAAAGIDTINLFDAQGQITAQIRGTESGNGVHRLAGLGRAIDVLNVQNQLRTETLYDQLGHVLDNTSSTTLLSVLQLQNDGSWSKTTPPYSQAGNDSLIVIGRLDDLLNGKKFSVDFRQRPSGAWTAGGARVLELGGYPVFSTGGLASGDYEYRITITPPPSEGEPPYAAGGGQLTVTSGASSTKNAQLAALYLMLLGRAPDPYGLNWWMDKYNQGVTLATIAGGIYLDSKTQAGNDAGAVVDQMFRAIGQPLPSDPGYNDAKTALLKRLQLAGSDQLQLGQIVAGLLQANLPALAARANAAANYLQQGGSDADVAARLVALAATAPDAAITEGNNAAKLENQRAQVARLYLAVLNRAPDKTGFDFWTNALASGFAPEGIALNMLKGDEANAANLLPSATLSTADYNDKLVKLAYANLLGRAPTDAELAGAKAQLTGTAPNASHAAFLINLGNQVSSYSGGDTAARAARTLLFDKVTVCLAYATLPSPDNDMAQLILVNKAAIAAISGAADARTAAAQATQLLKTQAQAALALADVSRTALNATPLETLRTKVSQLFAVLLNRVPDHDGFQYWIDAMKANNVPGGLKEIAAGMLANEGNNAALYPADQTDVAFLTRLFSLGLGYPAGAALTSAVATWQPRLAGSSRAQIALDIINALMGSNAAADQSARNLLSNRAAVGVTYALNLGANDLAVAKTVLALVTDTDIKRALDTATPAATAAAAANANANLAAIKNLITQNATALTVAQAVAAAQAKLAPAQKAADANPLSAPLVRAAQLYLTLLNRNSANNPDLDLYGVAAMAQRLQNGSSDAEMAQAILDSDEGRKLFSPDPAQYNPTQFVTQLYLQALGRKPDPVGQAYWVAAAQNFSSRAQVAVALVQGFLLNPVDDSNPSKVDNLQGRETYYKRLSDALTKLSTVAENTATAQAAATLAATNAKAATDTAKAAATAVTNAANTNSRFVIEVSRLYVGLLNRGASTPIDINGLNFYTRARIQNFPLGGIATNFLNSDAGVKLFQGTANNNVAFVNQIYQQVLKRDAEPTNGWVAALNSGTSRGDVAAAIITSLGQQTFQTDTDYTAKANFDQRVADAMKTVAATAGAEATADANAIPKRLAEKNAANTALQNAQKALTDANNLIVANDPAVIAASAQVPRGLAFLASTANVKAVTEVLVAFGRPADFNTVLALVNGLGKMPDSLNPIIAQFVKPLTDRTAFFKDLYSKVLQRDPDTAGINWWIDNTSTVNDPGLAGYYFLKAALVELYAPIADISKRLGFQGEFDAVNTPNVATANALVNAGPAARADAATRIRQAQELAAQNVGTAQAAYNTADIAWQDANSINTVAQVALAALNASATVQTAAVTADKAMAASLAANAKLADAAASVGLPVTATAADYTALAALVANVKKAAVLDASLATALSGVANADVARTNAAQNPVAVSPLAAQIARITRIYAALTAKEPTQIQLNNALADIKGGKTDDYLANAVIAANSAIYPATGMSNDDFIKKVFLTAMNRAPSPEALATWRDALNGASRGAVVNAIIRSITGDTISADTAFFTKTVDTLLAKEATAAQAAVTNLADFIAANSNAMRVESTDFDATAQAALPPAATYATEINQVYLALLGRAPEPGALLAGVGQRVGSTTLQTLIQGILDSAEVTARLSPSMTDAQFVTALYTLGLGRAPDAAENTAALALLAPKAPGARAQLVQSLIKDLYAYNGNDALKQAARTAFMAKVSANLERSVPEIGAYAAMLKTAADRSALVEQSALVARATDGRVLGIDSSTVNLSARSIAHITVDRWGNVQSISDARDPNWKIVYSYNYDNQQLSQTLNSLTPLSAPASKTVYDALGRVVKTTDFNGNSNTQRYDSNGKMVQEGHADGGTITYKYNLFGDRSAVITTRGQGQSDLRTDYTYDHLGHLTGTKTAAAVAVYFNDNIGSAMQYHNLGLQQLEERFEYDELGRKTRNTDGAGVSTYLSYDLDGNVISTMTQGNLYRTRTAYDALHHRVGTKDAMDHTMSWQVDSSGRINHFTDMSGTVTDYEYDAAGNRTLTRVNGKTITQTYENGLLVRIVNSESGMTTAYTYDAVGNRLNEQQSYSGANTPVRKQNNTLIYDMQNRLKSVTDDLYQLRYGYDNNGNRTSTTTKYSGTDEFTKYNAYDKMNRQTVVNADSWTGALNTSKLGKLGHLISYDQAGNRSSDSFIGVFINKDDLSVAKDTLTTESYAYDDVGRLQYSYRDGVKFETRNYDATGRVTRAGLSDYVPLDTLNALSAAGIALQMRSYSYDIAGHLTHQSEVNNIGGKDTPNRDIYFIDDNDNSIKGGYDAMGNLRDYTVTTQGYNKDDYGRYHIDYIWTDSAREHIVQQNTKPAGTTTSEYDSFGNRTKVIGTEGAPTKQFWYDADGHVQSKLEDGKTSFSLIVNGQMMGEENTKADNILGSTYQPASSATLAAAPSSYSVQSNSETLQSIAQAIWGDSKLWYLIADANGKTVDQALKAGEILRIPSRVNTVHNDYATFNPYNASDAIGNTAPALPPPSHGGGGCGGMGTLIMVVVAVAVTVLTQGAAAGAIASFLGGSTTAGIVAVAADAALAAAAGSLASQAVGVAIGAQDGISWSAVRNAAVNSAGTTFLIGAPISTGDNVWAAAAQGALRSAVSQGVGMLANQQSSFNWRTVAAAAAGNALSTSVTSGLNDSSAYKDAFGSYAGLTTATLSGMSAGLTSALVRGGKIEVTRVATDAFGNALGSSLADSMTSQSGGTPMSPRQAERAQFGGMSMNEVLGGEKNYLGMLGTNNSPNAGGSWDSTVAAWRAENPTYQVMPQVEIFGKPETAEYQLSVAFGLNKKVTFPDANPSRIEAQQSIWSSYANIAGAYRNGQIGFSDAAAMAWDNTKFAYQGSQRTQGAVQAINGGLEVWGGTLLSGTGVGAAVGLPVAFHGGDNIGTGLRRLWTGEAQNSVTYNGVEALTGSRNTAAFVDKAIPLAGAVANVAALRPSTTELSAAEQAAAWQGEGLYPGVDRYRDITVKSGTYIVGASPGQGNYYTTLSGMQRSGLDVVRYYEGVQLTPNLTNPLRDVVRDGFTVYRVEQNTAAAFGRALANSQYGGGKLPQMFLPDYSALTPVEFIPFVNKVPGIKP
ncbi:DUF4214 domain-containing protein [Duganella sp. HH105]|uniref:DUF4214 domain-containing protein n=1 Tax=Duganella sp. HH105 TaxID=1781067 RepID=UPI000877B8A9|nr:DUF4214 domain-containing protein [Duganella sp. HH105]OEZ52860.1 tRNA3(Ser)-specific nuclease WapA precursor [Duganella sp. HH105]